MIKPPQDYCCPITGEIMADPVMAADGHSYERTAIMEWLAQHNTSPLTNEELEHLQLIPNRTLKKAIQSFVEQHKTAYRKQFIDAMKAGDYETILHLEKLGIDIKATDQHGWSLIHHAASRGVQSEINELLKKGLLHNNKTASAQIHFSPPELLEQIREIKANISLLEEKKKALSNNKYYYANENILKANNEQNLKYKIQTLENKINSLNQEKQKIYQNAIQYPSMFDEKSVNYSGGGGRVKSIEQELNKIRQELKQPNSDYHALASARIKAEKELRDIENDILACKSLLNKKEKIFQDCNLTYTNLTPLHLAINNPCLPVIELFLDQGFSIEDKDVNGATFIFWSIYKNNFELFNLLIEKGANVEAVDDNGNTLLHAAAQYADKTIIDYLLKAGFYYRVKNNKGQTPIDIATKNDRIETANYIEQQGEKLWQNMPKRLAEQNKRIVSLEQQMKLLQDQVAILLKSHQNAVSNSLFKSPNENPASTTSVKTSSIFTKPASHSSNDSTSAVFKRSAKR